MPAITGVEWVCVDLFDSAGAPQPVSTQPPTMLIDASGKASGFAGVNRFFSEATFGNSITAATPIRFGPVGATRMAGPPERMALESAFTSMLSRVRSARVASAAEGDAHGPSRPRAATAMLVLSGDDGVLARFIPVPDGSPAAP